MKWTRFRIKTKTEAEDVIISNLYDIGLDGAQIEDRIPLSPIEKEQMFVDIPPDYEEDDGIAYLSFFVEQALDGSLELNGEKLSAEAAAERIKDILSQTAEFIDIGDGSVTVDETEDLDWINNWKQYFHSFMIDDIYVVPSWEAEDTQKNAKYVLHIDPGTAFGTGMHETTQLCIRELKKYVKENTKLLDVGTGSGILSILSLMFGAKCAVGTELDPCAVPAVDDNCRKNGIDREKIKLIIGNIITDEKIQRQAGYESYDIVVANILADVLIPLTPIAKKCLRQGGVYITSGIIEGREDSVKAAMEQAGLRVVNIAAQGEWRSITAVND